MTTRRSFLKGLGAAGAALGGFTACGGGGGGSSSGGPSNPPPPPPPPPVNQPILVSVYLEGGVDWLNLLVPNAGGNVSAYGAARPSLAIPLSAATDLGSGVSLNNDFTGFAALHAAGRVAWVPGIGMPGATLSHFSAKDLWAQSGVLNGTGWLGRFADTAFVAGGDPLRGIVTTPDVPTMFKGSTRSFASIPASTGFVFPSTLSLGKVGAPYAAQALEDAWGLSLATVGTDPVSLAAHTAVRAASKAFFDGQNAFGTDGTLPYRGPSVTYPGGSLSAQLILIAQMIATGIPGQVYGARLGGFDTHGDQAGVLPGLLRESGGALKAFWDDLAAISMGTGTAQDKVLILVWSEFGRRIRENDGGTDHGTAGLAFCIGKSLTGGFYGGGYPNLADPDVNGNMKATTDFRSLHATVLERHLGAAATTTNTLLGANYPRLSFL